MPFICEMCSNKTEFIRTMHMVEYATQEMLVTEEDEEIDYLEYEVYDSDVGDIEFRCAECNSECIEEVSETEWEQWQGPVHVEEKHSFSY